MKIEILIPTHHKTKEDLLAIYDKLSLNNDVLFANQIDQDDYYEFEYKNHIVRVICSSKKGISANRNTLLDHMRGDLLICTDDDCRLIDNYEEIIASFFASHPDAEVVLFNGIVTKEGGRLVHDKASKRVRRISDVSYAGGPGFVFKRQSIINSKIRFDERLCLPNYICLGEDSVFANDLVHSQLIFYRSHDVIFSIDDDVDNSSYFKVVDERFVISRGYIIARLHPFLKHIYFIKSALRMRNWRGNTFSIFKLYKLLIRGSRYRL